MTKKVKVKRKMTLKRSQKKSNFYNIMTYNWLENNLMLPSISGWRDYAMFTFCCPFRLSSMSVLPTLGYRLVAMESAEQSTRPCHVGASIVGRSVVGRWRCGQFSSKHLQWTAESCDLCLYVCVCLESCCCFCWHCANTFQSLVLQCRPINDIITTPHHTTTRTPP